MRGLDGDGIPEPLFILEPVALRVIDANHAAVARYGHARERLLDLTLADLDVEADPRSALEAAQTATTHRRYRCADGAIREVSLRAATHAEGFLLLALEAEASEDAVALAQFRHLAEISTDMIGFATPQAVWCYVSPASQALLGYSPEELVGRQSFDFVHPDDLANIATSYGAGMTDPTLAAPVIFRMIHRSGRAVWVEAIGKMLCRPGTQEVDQIYFSFRDITARRRVEDELRSSELRLRQLIEGSLDGILVVRDDLIVYANRTLTQLLGYDDAQALLGRNWRYLVLAADHDAVLERQHVRLTLGAPRPPFDVRFLHCDGSTVLLEAASLDMDFDGAPAVVVTTRDVAERRRIEQRMLASDRMASVGALAAGVAHEINNPLAYVIANLSIARESLALVPPSSATQEIDDALAQAREGAERVRAIVRDLKSFTRTDEDKRGPVDVRRAIEQALAMAHNELRHRARLVLDHAEVPPVDANEARLAQVFLNLIVNAAQALPEREIERNQIRLTTRHRGGEVVTRVEDNGSGIAPENLARIFDPFFTTKPIGIGTGLGLSVCHNVITSLGGTIEVESRLNEGTTFTVRLPALQLDAPAAPEVTPPPAAPAPHRRSRILVIDDEVPLAHVVRRLLGQEHEVVVATRAVEALALLRDDPRFDLVICDLAMPEMTGMDLHDELSRSHPALAARFVFMSGGAFTPRARDFLATTNQPRIEKPFDPKQLRALVREWLLAPSLSR